MKTFKKILLAAFATMVLAACAKDEELLFDDKNSIYVDYQDSTEYTFATSPGSVVKDSFMVSFRISGTASSSDRTFNLVPVSGATAKLGYHYSLGPLVIKANTFQAIVPIYFYRKPGLKDSLVQATLEIQENENFKQGIAQRQRFKFRLSDIFSKPTNWETTWASYFGSYSEVKFRFLLTATGKTNWNSSPLPQDSRVLSQIARNALLEYNQQNGALIDEFGQEVSFP
ncbi:DUF4843 domain-containing protein [Pedobacter deserti]|uniref:DUF4843 domain-containing protein n=1 Tax=Pedobacter deserti TaxID=2817382 RepID=UPI00210E261C|nr:DUF4843 domain-containing protein [Pedobacter sp. SYSU D00382]